MPSSRKGPHQAALTEIGGFYRVDSISNPQASRRGSGMYLEFLFLRAHSRRRVERMYWSGWSLNSFTTCSNSVIVGTTGPIGSGLPQLGLPRRFAIFALFPLSRFNYVDDVIGPNDAYSTRLSNWIRATSTRIQRAHRPMGNTRVGSQTEGLETGYYTSFFTLDQRKIQILTAGGRDLSKPAMIFAYLPWNETVEDETGKQQWPVVSCQ